MTDELFKNDDYLVFLLRQCSNYKLQQVLNSLIDKIVKAKSPKTNKALLLNVVDLILAEERKEQALEILKPIFENHGQSDKLVQSKFLNLLADVNLSEAIKIQQKIKVPISSDVADNDEYLT